MLNPTANYFGNGKMLAKNQFSPTQIRNNKQKWEHSACFFVAVAQGCQKPTA
jgi:hypothetical protein